MEECVIHTQASLREALICLNKNPSMLTLFIADDQKRIVGSLTDGDIRRGLISGLTENSPISAFMNPGFTHLIHGKFTRDTLHQIKARNLHLVPVLNEDRTLVKIINFQQIKTLLPVDAVIMAGGKGLRLLPLTATVPKPLLKIGDKPILDYNLDLLRVYGIQFVTISVNYLSDQIIEHVGKGSQRDLHINYVQETEAMGTIGSVKLIRELHNDYVLVMNSDLLTTVNLEAMFDELLQESADMVVATTTYRVEVPYGVVETQKNRITGLREKPTYSYYSNAGIYIFKRELIELIPEKAFFNATDFIQLLLEQNKKIVNHPITGYWLDIGKHDDFEKAQRDIEHLSFNL